MIANEESLGFELLVGQNKQFDDMTIGGNCVEDSFIFLINLLIVKIIWRLNNNGNKR